MAIQGVTYDNQRVAAADHAALFQMFITDGVMSGCGMSTLRNTLTISSGSFILAGRLTKIVGSETITIPNGVVSTTKKLVAVCNMGGAHTTTEFGQFYFELKDSDYTLKKENINSGNGQWYEVEWATLTIDASSNITSYTVTIPEAGSSGGGSTSNFISDSDYTFSGDSNKILYTSDNTDWEIIILEAAAATLNFTKRPGLVDICLVAAGNNGYAGNAGNGNARKGGNGGEVLNSISISLEQAPYTVTVGEGTDGADHDTSIYNQGATDPFLKAYQNNGQENGGNDTNADGGAGVVAFGDDGVLNTTYKTRQYGAGGGRGGYYVNTSTSIANGEGGITGGGNGGLLNISNVDDQNVGSGAINTGSGAGGGRVRKVNNTEYPGPGGTGGSGIIIIRNHRTTPAA